MKQHYDQQGGREWIGLALVGVGLGLGLAAITRQLNRRDKIADQRHRRQGERIVFAITINRPIEQVYAFWRNFENFPRFMRHLESVQVSGSQSHWRAVGPAGTRFEWDAETIEDRENERISWRSLPSSDVDHAGSVTFARAPGARGTEVRVEMQYGPPAGKLGRTIAMLFGEEPQQQIKHDVRRVKQLLETGEIPLSDGPGLWRPAQPPAEPQEVKTLVGVRQ